MFGGFKVQGKSAEAAKQIIEDAKRIEAAGASMVVLEGIPTPLAKVITETLTIPTIGIGAGKYCDGQVLVYQDMLGMFGDFKPKFVKVFANTGDFMKNAFGSFILEMKELSESDDSVNVVIKNSFNTTVENWTDDDIATGEIDFGNIQEVDIACREMTYRIEEREEFDIVMTNFLTEQDGWQHYETKTVEYEVPNGYEYTFLIYYKNGKKEMRVYHESSQTADMLIEISDQMT
jgi:hypothetical protein